MTFEEDLHAGARTVISVAEQFEELKVVAERMLQSNAARSRGFFTPTEDLAVRQLLIFYWKSRCALVDVVSSFHGRLETAGPDRARLFFVGFAGALVLVDAARWLRKHFHDQPVIRQKLNEPEPMFGIPEDVYDMVQESYTRPLHIWHLYHASAYFEEHNAELRAAVAEDPELAPLLFIIDKLLSQLRISKREYSFARLRVRTRQLVTGLNRDLFQRAIFGIQKLAGNVAAHVSTRPGHRPHLPPHIVQELRGFLAPGDVIVTRREHALTNYFLPGHWPHAALFLGDPKELARRGLDARESFAPRWTRLCAVDAQEPQRVLEAMRDGVLMRSLRSPCGTDSVVVLRPKLFNSQIDDALDRAMGHEGKHYDFSFDFTRSDRLVCTEVVYRAYQGIGDVEFQLSTKAGRLVLSGNDLVQKALRDDHFAVAGVYLRETADRLLTDRAAYEAVERVATS